MAQQIVQTVRNKHCAISIKTQHFPKGTFKQKIAAQPHMVSAAKTVYN